MVVFVEIGSEGKKIEEFVKRIVIEIENFNRVFSARSMGVVVKMGEEKCHGQVRGNIVKKCQTLFGQKASDTF